MSEKLLGRAVLFAGGPHPLVTRPSQLDDAVLVDAMAACTSQGEYVVAADSGLHLALACGQLPDLVIGDMDSVNPVLLDQAVLGGSEIRTFPADKDATDLELALEAVLSSADPQIGRVTVIGSGTGRMDHLFAGFLLLAAERFTSLRIDAWFGSTYVAIVRDSWSVSAQAGQLVSILALNGTAFGVRCTGLRWAFNGDALEPGSTRGASNQFVDADASVSLDSGVLAVILTHKGQS